MVGNVMSNQRTIFNLLKALVVLGLASLALVQLGCTNFNDVPPVTTLENPARSRTIGDYPVAGKVLAVQVCAACHGVNGYSNSPVVPNLAGQQKDYLVNQLQDYRDRSRRDKNGVLFMWGMARNLSDTQIQELANYFSSLPANRVNTKYANDSRLARGKIIFEKGIPEAGVIQCNSCHGADGRGMATFPQIAGQHPDYILQQLNVWMHPDEKKFMEVGGNTWAPRTVTFARPRGVLMLNNVKNLSQEDADAVAVYLSTLQ